MITDGYLSSSRILRGLKRGPFAEHIHLYIEWLRRRGYANVTGFGCECAKTTRLAQILAPYWKWNRRHLTNGVHPDDGGFTADQVRELACALLHHVSRVTGHGRGLNLARAIHDPPRRASTPKEWRAPCAWRCSSR